MLNHTCLCCSSNLIRHIRSGRICWYCPHCRQETLESISDFSKSNLIEYLKSNGLVKNHETIPALSH